MRWSSLCLVLSILMLLMSGLWLWSILTVRVMAPAFNGWTGIPNWCRALFTGILHLILGGVVEIGFDAQECYVPGYSLWVFNWHHLQSESMTLISYLDPVFKTLLIRGRFDCRLWLLGVLFRKLQFTGAGLWEIRYFVCCRSLRRCVDYLFIDVLWHTSLSGHLLCCCGY